ncbi:vitamin B12-dependent ribonucleotide reductase [Candidatus Woesearchaeota archaeon]|nr:vitamin B12-dependent ribonucleotide reductase [Candidatus Woesearchaeota archaeon]MBT5272717.1 vitamin B12-dependent ribonucleotide reductase [Candidatus Woesearchaeota archaeon]MBT6040328.1 vitamin B12-dependent ribonucleotide reductase [Candidatus Woesearchaeota archaeon]MBT6337038.1 vitamin B12-dependent ribonucleotide reductase [Candidatus Woesearchaeota archaeon]MBT7927908.1 vitamin B12-dependent ribonucleotide reductase [Candidatus Woesearchaeota archaeon]
MEGTVGEILHIKKRDGDLMNFDLSKIAAAIFRAAKEVGGTDPTLADELAKEVYSHLKTKGFPNNAPTVEEIQDSIEKVLIEKGHAQTAKAFILYRVKRKKLRDAKTAIGVKDDIKMTLNAVKVLERRYLLKDKDGRVIETCGQMFRRVASFIAEADRNYGASEENVKACEGEFYDLMTKLEFLPNSPTFTGANTKVGQLSACFVLPIGDSMEEIFEAIKQTALIHKSGGGTGFSFSRLRPHNDRVLSTKGVASGPVSFMAVFDAATETVKQGGTRRGANMGILRIDHPDIMDFITAKEKTNRLNNFNISIAITDKFMDALEKDEEYELLSPRDQTVIDKLKAKNVFELIVTKAWENGEPGIIFIDKINKYNPTPEVAEIESTNPCGEQPLLPFESCNLGSINLSTTLKEENGETKVDYDKLKRIIYSAVHFLDNVIDMNKFPLLQIEEMTRANRKIGLGVMGFANMLLRLGVRYNSDEGIKIAEEVMGFVDRESKKASQELAKKRGPFPNYSKSIYKDGELMRNATTTTIAPTGTLSILANCSSGVEPLFAISYIRNIMDNTELVETNPVFLDVAKKEGFYSEELLKKVAMQGSIQNMEEIPEEIRKPFVISHDISPVWHTRMQAAFQKHVDNAVSKTVNFPNSATIEEVREVYLLAYKLGCKGVTVYRDGSRDEQVLNIGVVNKGDKSNPVVKEITPEVIPTIIQETTNDTSEVKEATIDPTVSNDPNIVANLQAQSTGNVIDSNITDSNVIPPTVNVSNITASSVAVDATKEAILKAQEALPDKKKIYCPECNEKLTQQEGCVICPNCSFSACHM